MESSPFLRLLSAVSLQLLPSSVKANFPGDLTSNGGGDEESFRHPPELVTQLAGTLGVMPRSTRGVK
jgi:hypothetical protein